MKYEIMKEFKGSQDGRFTETFEAGTQVELSDYLVGCIPADWVKPVKSVEVENKAITTDGDKPNGDKPKRGKAK